MPGFFDRQDAQSPKSREAALFRDLFRALSFAKSRSPALRRQIDGIDLRAIRARADLCRIPLLRRADLIGMQHDQPPWGGLGGRRRGAVKNVIISPGPIFIAEGFAKDWWRAARALHAAGVSSRDIVLNGFDHRHGAGARMVESGAQALGCAACPIGLDDAGGRIEALRRLPSPVYFGPARRLRDLVLDAQAAGMTPFPVRAALANVEPTDDLDGVLSQSGGDVRLCYIRDEVGVIAYQSRVKDPRRSTELVVNEGLIVEIVDQLGRSLPFGSVGEIVVSRIDPEFPLLRFATGDSGTLAPGPSPCGRTNFLLLPSWLGRSSLADRQTAGRAPQRPAEAAALQKPRGAADGLRPTQA